jgi:hypothetical protein
MINRKARDSAVELIRKLISGHITNDEFEDGYSSISNDDSVIDEIYHYGTWYLYDDLKEHKLVGKYKLTDKTKSELAVWILFLKTDLEYEWPHGLKKMCLDFIDLCTIGFSRRIRRIYRLSGDDSVWPFYRKTDFERAKANEIYFKDSPASSP